ncbi:MAG: fumarylacetoacetate hydrolase family protein, partial [Pseudomonadota bacterium]
ADYGDLDARTMAADNAWCAGGVLGPEIEGWRDMDVEGTPVALLWNDEPAVAAKVGDADPFGSLAWVANVLTSAGRTIRAGEVVITGSVIKTRAPKAGDRVRYRIGELAEVTTEVV